MTVLILICLGQIWAIFRGRLTAAIYYCSVAPLGYFSVWKFATWGPDRLCGILLIAGGLLVFRRVPGILRFRRHPLAILLAFLIVTTLIGTWLWPVHALAGKSAVYGQLRGLVQIVNWLILAGAAWQVAIVLSCPDGLKKAMKVLILVGVLHSMYAIYQMVAYSTGLPATGIRRPYEGVGMESGGEQVAAFQIMGEIIYRPGSLIGEPKGLGGISLIWISAMLALYMERKATPRLKWAMVVSVLALFFTFSTSAWAGFIGMISIALWTARWRFSTRLMRILWLVFLLIFSLIIVDVVGLLPEEHSLASLIQERTVMREYLADLAEIEAMWVLSDHPEMLLWGAGLGGMTFYIAENLGGSNIVLFPNTGLLAYICDMGIIGISLLILALWGGLRPTLLSRARVDTDTRFLSFIGTICLMQTFIFDAGIGLFALAFLLAAEFRWRALKTHVLHRQLAARRMDMSMTAHSHSNLKHTSY